jgi:hypothetical protein
MMKLIKELIQEGKRLNLGPHSSQMYTRKGYDDKKGFITGGGIYSNNWSREDIELAVGEIKKTKEFAAVEKRMPFNSTPGELKNGTLSFKSDQANAGGAGKVGGTTIKVYLGGQIRSQTKTPYKERSITRIKSPKPKMVAGDPVASAVKAYQGALQAVADRYDRIASKKEKQNAIS